MDRADQAVGARLDMLRNHPALLGVEGLLVEAGEHPVGLETRGAELLDLLDRGATDFANRHGACSLERDDAADRLALVHQVEGVVDLLERHDVGDQRIDVDLAVHVPVDDLGHVAPALGAAEGRALPDPPRDELERPRRDLLAGAGDADDDRLAPAAMAAFERLAHQLRVADALEGVVGAAVGQLDEMRDQVLATVLRVDEVRHAELAAELPRAGLRSTPTIMLAPTMPRALHDVEADAAEAEHHDVGAGLDLGGVDHGADARRHAAADVADLVERRVWRILRQRDLGQHGVVREGRAAHVVMDLLAPDREAAGAVGHDALPCVPRIAVQRLVLRERHDLHWRHSGV